VEAEEVTASKILTLP